MDLFNIKLISLVMVITFSVRFATAANAQEITVSPVCHSASLSCVSLPELVVPSSGSIALILLPGIHGSFSSRLAVEGRANLSITGTPQQTIVNCAAQRSPNLQLRRMSNIVFMGVIFVGCNIQIVQSNNTKILQTVFVNGSNGALEFSNSFGISIDRSTFKNNRDSSFGGVIEIDRSKNFAITRTNFTDSIVSSFGAVVSVSSSSSGYISCCKFRNNSASSFGGIIKTESGSVAFVTNSSFTQNRVGSFGGVILSESGTETVTVISCMFSMNTAGTFGGIVKVESGISTILASSFSNNHAYNGAITGDSNVQILVDCTHLSNNSAIRMRGAVVTLHHTSMCTEWFAQGEMGVCIDNDCEVCRPPEINITMEFTEYSVNENIQSDDFALQVCAVATDVPFQIKASIEIVNGTAQEGTDFLSLSSECRVVIFVPREGSQRLCSYIEILDDSEIEADEQFNVRLSSSNPQTILANGVAAISIVDDDGAARAPTTTTEFAAPTTATEFTATPTVAGGSKTALVECGVFSRPVTFPGGYSSLQEAIVRTFSFTGLESRHIALLQMKSTEESFRGNFVDIVDLDLRIEHYSVIRVVLYCKDEGICKL